MRKLKRMSLGIIFIMAASDVFIHPRSILYIPNNDWEIACANALVRPFCPVRTDVQVRLTLRDSFFQPLPALGAWPSVLPYPFYKAEGSRRSVLTRIDAGDFESLATCYGLAGVQKLLGPIGMKKSRGYHVTNVLGVITSDYCH